jgi:hypothetical protein
MSEQTPNKKSITPDWLVRGVLTKFGDVVDSFTGRGSSNKSKLATSGLIDKLKALLDSEVKEDRNGKFVPHKIKLKMQWDKFSTDEDDSLKKLEYEIHAAAIDHINDNRYHTYAPIKVEVKPDYFTEGVHLIAGFDKYVSEEEQPEADLKISIPNANVKDLLPPEIAQKFEGETILANFTVQGKQIQNELQFIQSKRLSVGRSKENDLAIADGSVSKNHGSLVINSEGKFMVADTGSTNGTFINGNRMAYGRAFEINEGDKVTFGTIDVFFKRLPKQTEFVVNNDEEPAPTQAGIQINLE